MFMKLNTYTKVISVLSILLINNNIYSMENNNAAPKPITCKDKNIDEIIQQNTELQKQLQKQNEIIQQNIKLQKQLDLLNKQVKDIQNERRIETEDKIREEKFIKILHDNACKPQQYESMQCNYKYNGISKKGGKPTKCTYTIDLNNSQEFYDTLHNMASSFLSVNDITCGNQYCNSCRKYYNYSSIFDNRLNSQMIINARKWINYLESLSKECPIHDMKYNTIRNKIPSLINVNKELKMKLNQYQELIKEIKVLDPIKKMISDLKDKIEYLQISTKYEQILNIEKEIQELMNTSYKKGIEFEKNINKLNK